MRSLERQIDKVKRDLMRLDGLRMGSLSEQYNVCGTPGCRCKSVTTREARSVLPTELHEERQEHDPLHTEANLAVVKRQLRNYARLRSLVDRWIDWQSNSSDLQLEEAKQAAAKRRARG